MQLTELGAVLTADEQRGRAIQLIEHLNALDLPTLEPYLPLLFQLRGKPYHLNDHFPFSALLRTRFPRRRVLKTGRQVSKSTYLSVSSLLLAAKCPYSIQLFICPLFEQVRRFSTNYLQPFIDESIFKHLLVDTSCNQSVLQRTFLNRAMMHFSYAYLSAARIRGVGGVWWTRIDEYQDFDTSHEPVIQETMSAAPPPWGLLDKTGTPKGLDNPLHKSWDDSSQAEWFVPCPHAGCGKMNICATEFDLMQMIGPMHDDIGPNRPGTVCARCQKPVDPRTGFWKHRFEELRWQHQGFHIPQPILPMHYANPVKWAELLAKMQGKNNVAPNMFQNEVLGESCDTGAKLLTKSELQAACVIEVENDPRRPPVALIEACRPYYRMTVLGVDWGGGGGDAMTGHSEKARKQRVSFTTLAFMGLRNNGKIDVLWGCRLMTPNDHAREAAEIHAFLEILKPTRLAHDLTGAGSARETILVQAGVPHDMFVGIDYKHIPAGVIMQYIAGDAWDKRPHYRVDKTRTLQTTINAIKFGMIRFFRYDNKGQADPGMLDDFLSLTEEKIETMSSDRYLIRRILSSPDDFAHSVNVGCCTMWHAMKAWPDFIHQAKRSPADLGEGDGWQGFPKR